MEINICKYIIYIHIYSQCVNSRTHARTHAHASTRTFALTNQVKYKLFKGSITRCVSFLYCVVITFIPDFGLFDFPLSCSILFLLNTSFLGSRQSWIKCLYCPQLKNFETAFEAVGLRNPVGNFDNLYSRQNFHFCRKIEIDN